MRRLLGLALLAAAGAAQADAGRALAANCVACHGTRGAAADGLLALAGLPQAHLLQQLQAFRSGQRASTVMQQIAKGYDEAQLQALAAYFAAQPRGASE